MNYANIFKKEQERLEKFKQYDLIKLDLLTIEQVESLKIFKKYGKTAAITDFSVVLGGYIDYNAFTNDEKSLANRTGWWWTKSPTSNTARAVDYHGYKFWSLVSLRDGGCRPTLLFSSISRISSNVVSWRNGILEVEFGEYPQWVCSNDLSKLLEKLYEENKLNKTGKVYTTDSRHYDEYDKGFESQEHIEYEYNGKKYVRVKVNSDFDGNEIIFSNGEKYKDGDFVWISVSPIKWLVDEKNDIAITKNIIVSGIQFNNERNYTGDNFDKMNIKKFMDNYLSKEIIPSVINYKNPKEKIEIEVVEDAIKELEDAINDCSKVLEENYQKKLIK